MLHLVSTNDEKFVVSVQCAEYLAYNINNNNNNNNGLQLERVALLVLKHCSP